MFLCIYLFTICRLMLLLLFVCAGWYPVQHQVYVYCTKCIFYFFIFYIVVCVAGWYPVQHQVYVYCTCICIFFKLFFYIVVCVAGRYPVQYHYGLQRLGVRRQEGGRGGLHQSGQNFSLSETISSDFFVLIYKKCSFCVDFSLHLIVLQWIEPRF